jgi:hypothetical protein
LLRSHEERTRGDEAGDRFVPPAPGGMAGPSRHPIAPRRIRRPDEELYEDLCEALIHRDELDDGRRPRTDWAFG